MASRFKNLTEAFSNVKIRTVMILTVLVLGLVIVVGLIGFHRANQTSGASQVTAASNLQSVPGLNPTSVEYATTQVDVNKQNYAQAAATHGTNVPTIVNSPGLNASSNPSAYNVGQQGTSGGAGGNGSSENGAGNGNGGSGGANGESAADAAADAKLKALEAQQKAQMEAMQKKMDELSSQQEQQQVQQTENAMQRQAQQLLSAWNGNANNPTQQFVQGDWATSKKNNTSTGGPGSGGSDNNGNGQSNSNGSSITNNTMIKAGAILFGVLNTAVNSDEPGPVLVTIVSGQYKGAKLIGSIQSSPQIPGSNGPTKLILSFNTLSVPYLPESIGVSAVAIDPDTARTALASDVDHHYVERYGSLFASSFLEGYGQAITQAGSTTTVSPFGGTTTQLADLSGIQEVAAGFGQVGQNWGQQLGQTFNRQNTVTINSGISVGILFLSDVTQDSDNTPTAITPAITNTQALTTTPASSTAVVSPTAMTTTGVTATPTVTMPVTTSFAPSPVPVPTQ
ncbi:MAG: TrbI/VirB10 family protein [Gammaproteobacteria bacterium]